MIDPDVVDPGDQAPQTSLSIEKPVSVVKPKASEQSRIWECVDGRKSRLAKAVSVDAEAQTLVLLRDADKKEFTVAISQLSDSDKDWVLENLLNATSVL